MADHGRSGMVGRNYSYDNTDWKTGTVVQAEVFCSQYLQNGQPLLTHDYPIKSEFLIPVITSVCSLIFYKIRISTTRATMVPQSTINHPPRQYPFSHLLAAKGAYRRGHEVHVSVAF